MDNKQYVVIGMGGFGQNIAKCLSDLGEDVLVIDIDEDRIAEISPYVTHAVQADATDEKVLNALGLRNFDVAVVTMGSNIQSSILITMLCKEMGIPFVLAKAQNDLHAKVLCKTGADKVVFPERDMGFRIAHNLVASDIIDYIELAGDLRIMEITTLETWVNKSLIELDFRKKYAVNIIAIIKDNGEMNTLPNGEDVIHKGDLLVVVGNKEAISKLEKATKKL
ncbi:MAG: TrkA family potassium uptake protein [Eubacteriales bacterium]|nr:TrkA family potassium uptake protein [Eubacteriales bacterium]